MGVSVTCRAGSRRRCARDNRTDPRRPRQRPTNLKVRQAIAAAIDPTVIDDRAYEGLGNPAPRCCRRASAGTPASKGPSTTRQRQEAVPTRRRPPAGRQGAHRVHERADRSIHQHRHADDARRGGNRPPWSTTRSPRRSTSRWSSCRRTSTCPVGATRSRTTTVPWRRSHRTCRARARATESDSRARQSTTR